jgi:hypothetical protein
MKTKAVMLFFGLGLMLTLGCTKYPPQSDRLLEDLAIYTVYDTGVNFNEFKTYAIEDYILKITDKDTTKVTDANAQTVLNQINKNMQARGFVKVAANTNPDLQESVAYFENTKVYAYYGYYYPYYGYGWYYPYYPVYYTSYTAGLFTIDLFDMKNTAPNNYLYVRWNAGIRGLLTGSHTTSEITGAIDQAFIQTPQLTTTHVK